MNQTIAKLDVTPSRQQERGISGHRVFPLTTTQHPQVRELYYLASKVKALPAKYNPQEVQSNYKYTPDYCLTAVRITSDRVGCAWMICASDSAVALKFIRAAIS